MTKQRIFIHFTISLKKNYISSYNKKKIQILTLLPDSWSRQNILNELNVSGYFIRKAQKMKFEDGVSVIPRKKTGKYVRILSR